MSAAHGRISADPGLTDQSAAKRFAGRDANSRFALATFLEDVR